MPRNLVRDNLAMPLFLQGCCGDINCAPKDGTFEGCELLGTRLGAATVTAALQAERRWRAMCWR